MNDTIIMRIIYVIFWGTALFINFNINGQYNKNCFLNDFALKKAKIPPSVNAKKPADPASVVVTVQGDTLGKISKYVFGNAIAAWAGSGYTNTILVNNTKLLAPTLIRFPGRSWGDIYFWNGLPTEIPDSLYDGQTYNGSTAKKHIYGGNREKVVGLRHRISIVRSLTSLILKDS